MVITVTETLKQLDGTTIKDNDGAGNTKDATVRNAFVNALLMLCLFQLKMRLELKRQRSMTWLCEYIKQMR
jgi:hypothetical protein